MDVLNNLAFWFSKSIKWLLYAISGFLSTMSGFVSTMRQKTWLWANLCRLWAV